MPACRPWRLSAVFLIASAMALAAPGPVAGRAWTMAEPALELVWIPAGRFTMGSAPTETGRKPDEGPTTHVTLTQGFWLGKHFVTIGQWRAVMGVGVREQLVRHINDEALHDLGGKKQTVREFMRWSRDADPAAYLANEEDDLPMYFVSWDDAMAFAGKLTERERAAGRLPSGYVYTLPTEAQWEYACRAGTTGATYAEADATRTVDDLGWHAANSANGYTGRALGSTHSGPRRVGVKPANPWGLHDMYGNIWQWCRDWYGPYPGDSITDPAGPPTGTARVNRGGSFGSRATSLRSAGRAANPPAEASAYRGFRLALCPESPL